MQKLLTISIPTWNRSFLLEELLLELTEEISQFEISSKVQILISNNHSTDNTELVVLNLIQKFNFITYNKNSHNIGGKSNVLLSMELAQSQFVLFLGDDDRLRKNAIVDLVNLLENKDNIGILIDISKHKKNYIFRDGYINKLLLYKNFYWYLGNAGIFVSDTSYIRNNLNKFGYNFFNECWPQTQLMILGLSQSKLEPYIANLNLTVPGRHQEVMIYSSYYLWRTCVWDLFQSIESLKQLVNKEVYEACRYQMRQNIKQNFLNILQCGLFVDDQLLRRKTKLDIFSCINVFSFKEKIYLATIIMIFSFPIKFSQVASNIFIYLTKGKIGLIKKNSFVTGELEKKRKQQSSNNKIRYLSFENN